MTISTSRNIWGNLPFYVLHSFSSTRGKENLESFEKNVFFSQKQRRVLKRRLVFFLLSLGSQN